MVKPVTVTFRGDEGLTLEADTYGDPVRGTVLLAHGGGQTRHAWARACASLSASGWRAVAMDLRGHGQSQWSPSGDYRIQRFAGDLVQVAEQLGAARLWWAHRWAASRGWLWKPWLHPEPSRR